MGAKKFVDLRIHFEIIIAALWCLTTQGIYKYLTTQGIYIAVIKQSQLSYTSAKEQVQNPSQQVKMNIPGSLLRLLQIQTATTIIAITNSTAKTTGSTTCISISVLLLSSGSVFFVSIKQNYSCLNIVKKFFFIKAAMIQKF